MANNNMMDYGDDCLNETIKMFNNAQIFGVRTWEKAYSPIIVEQNDIRVALLSLTQLEFGVLKDYWIESKCIGIVWINHLL